jgi:hypothetical protein
MHISPFPYPFLFCSPFSCHSPPLKTAVAFFFNSNSLFLNKCCRDLIRRQSARAA